MGCETIRLWGEITSDPWLHLILPTVLLFLSYCYQKPEVVRFLLSQLAWFADEFQFDGFRFEAVTSMLYHHHGIGKDYSHPEDFSQFFSYETDDSSVSYLMVANNFLHSYRNGYEVLSIASDFSRAPTLSRKLELGGIGFDFRTAPHIAEQVWRSIPQNRQY